MNLRVFYNVQGQQAQLLDLQFGLTKVINYAFKIPPIYSNIFPPDPFQFCFFQCATLKG